MKQKSLFKYNIDQTCLTALFIGLSYLWTSCAYLAWTGHLTPIADSGTVYIATEVGGCIAQIFGILFFSWLVRSDLALALNSRLIIVIMILDGLCFLPVTFSGEALSVLIWGLVMNLFHGVIAGYYITRLSACVAPNRRALCFGGGYAFANILNYLLSLTEHGSFSSGTAVWFVTAALILLCIVSIFFFQDLEEESSAASILDVPLGTRLTAGAVIVILVLATQLLFFFPAQAYLKDIKILHFSHMFYAFGLITAAFINDRRRNMGLILALLSLCFPLLSLSLYRMSGMFIILSCLGYTATGFYAVYRIVVFTDMHDTQKSLLYLAPIGLAYGRLGEAAGAFLGLVISGSHILLTIVTIILFVASTILVFMLYVKLYGAKPASTLENRLFQFGTAYNLSSKEQSVLLLLIDGKTNKEIANELYISENTVKFHVKNILKKTACTKRMQVKEKFSMYQ